MSNDGSKKNKNGTDGEEETVTLLLVDVQKDFHPGGSLAIPTANDDAERIAELIRSHPFRITNIVATLDSHQKLHIAHPQFWVSSSTNDDGTTTQPSPFTIISHQSIVDGKWKPREEVQWNPHIVDTTVLGQQHDKSSSSSSFGSLLEYALEYTHRLETKGRFQLCIWPEHCLIGTDGHAIVDTVRQAMDEWSVITGRSPTFVFKGMHNYTEMYSALQAEVPVNDETSFNKQIQQTLLSTDKLLVCGQAKSHCVNYTLRDILHHLPQDEAAAAGRIYLLTDCSSPVPTFEEAARQLEQDVKQLGVVVCTAKEVFE